MPIFDKVIQETGNRETDLKVSLEDKLRQQKMRELDEAAIDGTVQATRTKTAEMEAREIEAQGRKVSAEANMMEKIMPSGVWGLLTEVLKDKNPQSPMTVQDMLTILEYARGQQDGGQGAEQPSEGMWGFLSTMMTSTMTQNKSITPLELVQSIAQLNAMMQPQQQQQGGLMSQLTEFANIAQTFRGLFGPSQDANPASMVDMPGGGRMTLEQLMSWQDHNYNLQVKRDEHSEKMKNWATARESAPSFIDAVKEFATSLRGEMQPKIKTGADTKKVSTESSKVKVEGKQLEKQEMQCTDCGLPFSLPADIDEDVACPRCSMQVLKRLEDASNAGKTDQGGSESEGPGGQGGDTGSGAVDLP